jgi:hypothetical protein
MNLSDAWFEQRFELEFLRARGDAFQTLFERVMALAYKEDFMACRPWGKVGDRKNDGFLKSQKCLFQCYAPDELTEAKATAKITDDFAGAKEYWGKLFEKWIFMHNATRGLPPHVHKTLLEFEAGNPGISIRPWCFPELRDVFRSISPEDKSAWLGECPKEQTKLSLGFAELQVVLQRIAGLPVVDRGEIREVPMRKIEANQLSEAVTRLLKEGMAKAPLVADFFGKWHDEMLGGKVAEAFKASYARLRVTLAPNQVFAELQSWAGGGARGTPEHELAVLAVLAYYFERCDIFEEPRVSAK